MIPQGHMWIVDTHKIHTRSAQTTWLLTYIQRTTNKEATLKRNCKFCLGTKNSFCTSLSANTNKNTNTNSMGGFICTFFLLISFLITLRTSKFRNQFTISSKYFDMACYLKQETYFCPATCISMFLWAPNKHQERSIVV